MCHKCIKTKTCTSAFLKQLGYYLHYKLQVHTQESNTISLQTTIAFKGIKILLHFKMSSKEPNTIAL